MAIFTVIISVNGPFIDISRQECIPVGCVPPAAGEGHLPGGCLPGDWCIPACTAMSVQGGVCLGGGGVVSQHALRQTPPPL